MRLRWIKLTPLVVIATMLLIWSHQLAAKGKNYPDAPSDNGNFALSGSQSPTPLYSFGQNIVSRGIFQLYFNPNILQNKKQSFKQGAASWRYGLADNLSLFITTPYNAFTVDNHHSDGYGDTSVQGEYAFIAHAYKTHTTQATIVGSVTIPSGKSNIQPPLGLGVPSYFGGLTFNQVYPRWLWFISPGMLYIQTNEQTHIGNQYFYQAGLSGVLASQTNEYIWAAMLELDGQNNNKNTLRGHFQPNSGGHFLYLTPSLWYSTKSFYIQAGVSLPINQQWSGNQPQNQYFASANIVWTLAGVRDDIRKLSPS